MAQDITQEETEAALSANDAQLLGKVQHALQRVYAGTYGYSEVTGQPIPFERLDALPWGHDEDVGDSGQHSSSGISQTVSRRTMPVLVSCAGSRVRRLYPLGQGAG